MLIRSGQQVATKEKKKPESGNRRRRRRHRHGTGGMPNKTPPHVRHDRRRMSRAPKSHGVTGTLHCRRLRTPQNVAQAAADDATQPLCCLYWKTRRLCLRVVGVHVHRCLCVRACFTWIMQFAGIHVHRWNMTAREKGEDLHGPLSCSHTAAAKRITSTVARIG